MSNGRKPATAQTPLEKATSSVENTTVSAQENVDKASGGRFKEPTTRPQPGQRNRLGSQSMESHLKGSSKSGGTHSSVLVTWATTSSRQLGTKEERRFFTEE